MNEAVYITLLFNVRNEQTNEKSYIGDALTRNSSSKYVQCTESRDFNAYNDESQTTKFRKLFAYNFAALIWNSNY